MTERKIPSDSWSSGIDHRNRIPSAPGGRGSLATPGALVLDRGCGVPQTPATRTPPVGCPQRQDERHAGIGMAEVNHSGSGGSGATGSQGWWEAHSYFLINDR